MPHAILDTDELDRVWPRPEAVEALTSITCRNLHAIRATYFDLGIRHLVLCGVMTSIPRSESMITEAIPGATITYVRLRATRSTRESRIRRREIGSGFEHDMRGSE